MLHVVSNRRLELTSDLQGARSTGTPLSFTRSCVCSLTIECHLHENLDVIHIGGVMFKKRLEYCVESYLVRNVQNRLDRHINLHS